MRGGPYAASALAVVSVSFASIFITWSNSPPVTIALYRLAIATGIIGATILLRGSLLRKPNTLLGISGRDAAVMALIGAILATHFALWISSLKVEGESIASAVVLVTSHPLLVRLLSDYVLRERLNRWMTVGFVLGFAGGVSLALADYGFAARRLYADISGLSGGVMAAGRVSPRRPRGRRPGARRHLPARLRTEQPRPRSPGRGTWSDPGREGRHPSA